MTRRYRSNCSCLCWMLNPPRPAHRARICLSAAKSRRAHLCLISRPHIQQRNNQNSGKMAHPHSDAARRFLLPPFTSCVFHSSSAMLLLQRGINNTLSRTRPTLLHYSAHLQQYDRAPREGITAADTKSSRSPSQRQNPDVSLLELVHPAHTSRDGSVEKRQLLRAPTWPYLCSCDCSYRNAASIQLKTIPERINPSIKWVIMNKRSTQDLLCVPRL